MSLYYDNFKYLDKNSIDQGLIVSAFEPDDGFVDSFLSMESVQEDYYDGTKKFDYGAKYNSTAVINIQVIKKDGGDFSLFEIRSLSKWLTGSRINSWLDVGPSKYVVKYSFLGRVTNLQQYKVDGRIIGLMIEFTSISPWAYSAEQRFEWSLGHIGIYNNGVTYPRNDNLINFKTDTNGVLLNGLSSQDGSFNISENGSVYLDNISYVDNPSDDLYTYLNIDVLYFNKNCDSISIKNETSGENTVITNMSKNETINLTANQFITSDVPNKVFGDNFNFVWPRLVPGINRFTIEGNVKGSEDGTMQFTYRYPMKIGDCAMDTDVRGGSVYCGS